jgi:hypothetical protein
MRILTRGLTGSAGAIIVQGLGPSIVLEKRLNVTAESVIKKKIKKGVSASASLITSKNNREVVSENSHRSIKKQNVSKPREITDREIMKIINAIVSKNKRNK